MNLPKDLKSLVGKVVTITLRGQDETAVMLDWMALGNRAKAAFLTGLPS